MKQAFQLANHTVSGWMPCVSTDNGRLIPIDVIQMREQPKFLAGFGGVNKFIPPFERSDDKDIFKFFGNISLFNPNYGLKFEHVDRLINITKEHIKTFLYTRLPGVRQKEEQRNSSPLVAVTVHTKNKDLQLYYTYNFSIHWEPLSSSVKPLSVELAPGCYLLGAEGGALNHFTFDEKVIIKIRPAEEVTFELF